MTEAVRILHLCWLALVLATPALAASEYRMFRGKLYDVTASPEWTRIVCHLTRAGSNSIRAEKVKIVERMVPSKPARPGTGPGLGPFFYKAEEPGGPEIEIRNFPVQPMEIGRRIECYAVLIGTNVGDFNLYEVYDYGRPATKEEITAEFSRRRAAVEAMARAGADRAARKREALEPKVLAYQHQQASNGLPSFQYELGLRYLRGDGVESNTTMALHWFRSAATNGHTRAKEYLTRLSQE